MFGQTAIFNGLPTGRSSKFLTEVVLHIPGMYSSAGRGKNICANRQQKRGTYRVCTSLSGAFTKGLHVKQEMFGFPLSRLIIKHIARNKIRRVTNG